MVRNIFSFLFGEIPYSLKSDYPLEESISRLKEATKDSLWQSWSNENAVGKVSNSGIRLQRVIPKFGNSFKPTFVGKLVARNGMVKLEGKFTMFLFTKFFMTFWLAFAAFWTIGASIKLQEVWATNPGRFESQPILMFFPLLGLGLLIIGVVLLKGGWKLSSGDIDYLKQVFETALTSDSKHTEIK